MDAPLSAAVSAAFSRHERTARSQAAVISCITSLMEFLVANKADLDAELALTKQAVTDDESADIAKEAADAATITARNALIVTLNAKIAELEASTDTQSAIDALKEIRSKLQAPATGTVTQQIP